jgi:hypothetical protein
MTPALEFASQVHLVLTQEEAQTLAAYVRLHSRPGPLMQSVRKKLEAEIEAGLYYELLACKEHT